MKARRLTAAAAAAVLAAVGLTLSVGAASGATTSGSGFTKTERISRVNLVNGKNVIVDKRTFTLNVDQTKNLRGRQEVDVSWSGAHPTGGIISDQNSIDAQEEEYPVVILECRGVDSTKVKASERLSQKTCWTQDWSERYQDSYASFFPPYRLDRYASASDRAQVAGAPKKLPARCAGFPAPTQHWVPFVAANGHTYLDGPAGCAGQPPEALTVGGSALPSNETFGVTGTDGRGSTKFDIWTSAENQSLGCTQKVACSLVAVPIMGISCDAAAKGLPAADAPPGGESSSAAQTCEETGNFKPGQIVHPEGLDDLSVSGSLWWSASNWRNRVSVPLSFAVPDNACDVVSNSNSVDVYGSEVLIQATGQWAPHFCLNPKLFKFTHVQTGEPEARNLLATGNAEAAFISDPPDDGYGKHVVNAPVALSGFSISYIIDGANGQPYTRLRMTPLLLAKLLTESYPAELPVIQEDPALAKNPQNITDDPEFQKLNPGITHGVSATEPASALLTLSSDSDVIQALTTYINDDPTARAWLNGKPDSDGMVVNPAYKGIKLPVNKWPLLSTFEPTSFYQTDTNDCLYHNPVPYLPLIAAPMARLEEIAEALQFSEAQSTTVCSQIDGTTTGEKLVPLGRQTVGYRFMIGVTSIADAHRYQLNSAALQTTSASTFVRPTDASLRAAAALLKPDAKTGTWPIPYEAMRSTKAGSGAYPGTMVVYTAVPTTGLPSQDAHDFASIIRFAVTSGQTPGLGVGKLPPGFLPLTKANGLASLAGYSLAAADAVQAQQGGLPALTGHSLTSTGQSHPSSSPAPQVSQTSSSTGGSSSSGDGTGPTTNVSLPPVASSSPAPVTSPTVANPPATTVAALGRTLGINLGGGGLVLLVVVGLAMLGGLGAPGAYFVGRKTGRW